MALCAGRVRPVAAACGLAAAMPGSLPVPMSPAQGASEARRTLQPLPLLLRRTTTAGSPPLGLLAQPSSWLDAGGTLHRAGDRCVGHLASGRLQLPGPGAKPRQTANPLCVSVCACACAHRELSAEPPNACGPASSIGAPACTVAQCQQVRGGRGASTAVMPGGAWQQQRQWRRRAHFATVCGRNACPVQAVYSAARGAASGPLAWRPGRPRPLSTSAAPGCWDGSPTTPLSSGGVGDLPQLARLWGEAASGRQVDALEDLAAETCTALDQGLSDGLPVGARAAGVTSIVSAVAQLAGLPWSIPADLVRSLVAASVPLVQHAPPRHLAHLTAGLVALGAVGTRFHELLKRRVSSQHECLSPGDAALLLRALAAMHGQGIRSTTAMEALMDRLTVQLPAPGELVPMLHDVSGCGWNHHGNPRFLLAVGGHLVMQLPLLSAQELVGVAEAYARARVHHEPLFEAVLDAATRCLPRFSAGQVARLASACAQMYHYRPQQLRIMAAHVGSAVPAVAPSELLATVQALARCNVADERFFRTVTAQAQHDAQRLAVAAAAGPAAAAQPADGGAARLAREQSGGLSAAVDVQALLAGRETRTSLFLDNLPLNLKPPQLLHVLQEACIGSGGSIDYFYTPFDYARRSHAPGLGSAHVNATSPAAVVSIVEHLRGRTLGGGQRVCTGGWLRGTGGSSAGHAGAAGVHGGAAWRCVPRLHSACFTRNPCSPQRHPLPSAAPCVPFT